jgi:hypothetical protein
MPGVGDGTIPRLVVDPFGVDTVATLTVVKGDDSTAAAAVSSQDGGHTWIATDPIVYSLSGLWIFRWKVAGTGFGWKDFAVNVTPDQLLQRRSWATTADLANWLNTTVPADARRMLAHATRVVEDLIKHARYDVDENDDPTDPKVVQAVKDAVCEQVNWWIQCGDEHGARGLYTTVSIGSATVSRSTSQGGNSQTSIPGIGRDVLPILRRAGLLDGQPLSW